MQIARIMPDGSGTGCSRVELVNRFLKKHLASYIRVGKRGRWDQDGDPGPLNQREIPQTGDGIGENDLGILARITDRN